MLTDFVLKGYASPFDVYPSAVVPIGLADGQLVSVFLDQKKRVTTNIVEPAAHFELLPSTIRDKLRGFDYRKECLFAFARDDLQSYAVDREAEFFSEALTHPAFDSADPLIGYILAVRSLRTPLLRQYLGRASRELAAISWGFAEAWYAQQVELVTSSWRTHGKFLSLPLTLRGVLALSSVDGKRREDDRPFYGYFGDRGEEVAVRRFGDFVFAANTPMERVVSLALRAAANDDACLIVGETGTGKTLMASAIHSLSGRKGRPMVTALVSGMPEGLIYNELFGHEVAAFSGATRASGGLIQRAHHGTLFLDELGDLPQPAQAMLLRFLDSGRGKALGATREFEADVRVLAATNRDPRTLRPDLVYRVAQNVVRIPPLRERDPASIAVLCDEVIGRFKLWPGPRLALTQGAFEAILTYKLPGNFRELDAIIRRASAETEDGLIRRPDIEVAIDELSSLFGSTAT